MLNPFSLRWHALKPAATFAVVCLGSIVTLAAPSRAADSLAPVHRAAIAQIESIRTDLKSGKEGVAESKLGQIDGHLSQAIAILREADAIYLTHHPEGFGTPAGASGASEEAEAPESQDVTGRLGDLKDDLTDYKPGQWSGYVGKAKKELDKAIKEIREASAKPLVPMVPITARQPWPSVDYAHFLPTSTDEAHRRLLWTYFFNAEKAAHAFAPSADRWVTLTSVQLVTGQNIPGEWSTRGVITLKGDSGPGTMFHEIFHTAFHRSVFHLPGSRDGRWTEGFCDAFRYAAEHEFMAPPKSGWTKGIDKLMSKTWEEAAGHHVSHWLMSYGYPASVVTKKSGGTMAGLQALWEKLEQLKAQKGGDIFADYFGWAPKGKGEY